MFINILISVALPLKSFYDVCRGDQLHDFMNEPQNKSELEFWTNGFLDIVNQQ